MSLGFADAISPSGKGLRKKDLAGAYRKAGTAFVGQMQQTFVVLHKRNGSGLELTTPERKKKSKGEKFIKSANIRYAHADTIFQFLG